MDFSDVAKITQQCVKKKKHFLEFLKFIDTFLFGFFPRCFSRKEKKLQFHRNVQNKYLRKMHGKQEEKYYKR